MFAPFTTSVKSMINVHGIPVHFHRMMTDAFLDTQHVTCPTREQLEEFLDEVVDELSKRPLFHNAILGYPHWHLLQQMFQNNTDRLTKTLVCCYFIHNVTLLLEADPELYRVTYAQWSKSVSQQVYSSVFAQVKAASIFRSLDLPNDDDTYAYTLNINIGEAMIQDLVDRRFENFYTGSQLLQNNRNNFTSTTTDSLGLFDVTREWIDHYMLWNLAFVTRFSMPEIYTKLLMPCLFQTEDNAWLRKRIISLQLWFVCTELNTSGQDMILPGMRDHVEGYAGLAATLNTQAKPRSLFVRVVTQLLSTGLKTFMSLISRLEYYF